MALTEKSINVIVNKIKKDGLRNTAKFVIDTAISKKVGLTTSDLSDTTIYADGLDEVEELLRSDKFDMAWVMAKDIAYDMLEDEGFNYDLEESRGLRGIILNELDYSGRKVYDNLLQLFQENNLKSGSFVSLGYFNKVEIPKRIYPSAINKEKANQLLQMDDDGDWKEHIRGMINNPIWDDTMQGRVLNKSKKVKNYIEQSDILGDISGIIKFSRYTFNFQDRSSLGKSFGTQREKEIELRRKYGFGKDAEEYDETDWRLKKGTGDRLKYRGHTLEPLVDLKDVNKGSSYKDTMGDLPIWGDVDMSGDVRNDDTLNTQRLSLRQNISSNLKREESKYFLVKTDGSMVSVPKDFVRFLEKDVKQKIDRAVEELQDEERQFVEELKELQSKFFVTQFILNKIAFFVGTVENEKTKEKEKIVFFNKDINLLDDNRDINKEELYNFLKTQFTVSTEEVDDTINESILKEVIKKSLKNYIKEEKMLNEISLDTFKNSVKKFQSLNMNKRAHNITKSYFKEFIDKPFLNGKISDMG